jgi:hypothetical protein
MGVMPYQWRWASRSSATGWCSIWCSRRGLSYSPAAILMNMALVEMPEL